MTELKKYRKKATQFVVAVQLDLETSGFTYQKWGAEQICRKGDWLIKNHDDTYTVNAESFAQTYRELSPGVYLKKTPVFAAKMSTGGRVKTREGESHYMAGDYVVSNNADGSDSYCVSADKFESMYELDR